MYFLVVDTLLSIPKTIERVIWIKSGGGEFVLAIVLRIFKISLI